MILKLARTGLNKLHSSYLPSSSIYFFSHQNNKPPTGFDKFSRKKKQNSSINNTEQETKTEEQQKKLNDNENLTEETNENNVLKSESNEGRKEGYDKEKMSTKEKSDETLEQVSPFAKFQRKSRNDNVSKNEIEKESTNKIVNEEINANNDKNEMKESKETPNESVNNQSKSSTEQDESLNNFEKLDTSKDDKNSESKELKGFEKFNKRNRNQTQSKVEVETKDAIHQTKENESENNGTKEEQVNNKHEESEAEKELKKREEYFLKKIQEFKNMKAGQSQNENYSNLFSKVSHYSETLKAKIKEKFGVDFDKPIDPPKYVKDNIFILFAWRVVFSKFMVMLILGYSILEIYEYFTSLLDNIEPEDFLSCIKSREASLITFVDEEFNTESESYYGKKNNNFAVIELRNGERFKCTSNNEFEKIVKDLVNELNAQPEALFIGVTNEKKFKSNKISTARSYLSFILMLLFIEAIFGASKAAGKKGQGMGKQGFNMMDQSKSKRFKENINVKFNDVVGMQKSKEEIVEFIDFLVNPAKYHKLGAKIPRGALLTGPPGTGKTMIAKACAGESNVPFFTISGSEFMEMYVGVGAQRVRDLFKEAKESSPSIIFIDEIDAVGKKRTSGFGGGNDERDNTLNQLLVEMDGFESNSNVIVFAATNQKEVLDPALTRPGRFDRLIEVDLPDLQGRKEIFLVHLKPIVIDTESNIEEYAKRMATLTPGFSGADIKNLCNEAAIMAARSEHKFVTMKDFELATERVIGGVEKKSHLITPETKKIVAYHECGHGVVSWFLEGANPLLKLTIIPRSKGAMGFAQYLPHETQISTKKQLMDQICVILSGRVSEEIFFGKISTGAYDDLQKAFNIAKIITTQYGMSDKLGWLSYEESEYAKDYSRKTEKIIDEEIQKIINECTNRARNLVNEKRDLIEKLAVKLLEEETIDLTTINKILGERPFTSGKQYEEYLTEHKKMVEENPVSISFKMPVEKRSDFFL